MIRWEATKNTSSQVYKTYFKMSNILANKWFLHEVKTILLIILEKNFTENSRKIFHWFFNQISLEQVYLLFRILLLICFFPFAYATHLNRKKRGSIKNVALLRRRFPPWPTSSVAISHFFWRKPRFILAGMFTVTGIASKLQVVNVI
jgi:hypothetical protein